MAKLFGRIFVRVPVDVMRDRRVLAIDRRYRCRSVCIWLEALAYTREQLLDGYCPRGALSQWQSGCVNELVRVGLLEHADKGVRVIDYASMNQTESEVAASRRAASERMARVRSDRTLSKTLSRADSFTTGKQPDLAQPVFNDINNMSTNVRANKRRTTPERSVSVSALSLSSDSRINLQNNNIILTGASRRVPAHIREEQESFQVWDYDDPPWPKEHEPSEPEPKPEESPAEIDRYRAAYEQGIVAALKRPWGLPRRQEGELVQIVQIFSEKRRGAELLEWLTQTAQAFGEFLRASPDQVPYYSEHGPRGALRWLNYGKPQTSAETKPGYRKPFEGNPNPVSRPSPPSGPRVAKEEAASHIGSVLSGLMGKRSTPVQSAIVEPMVKPNGPRGGVVKVFLSEQELIERRRRMLEEAEGRQELWGT
jgi:hypothetical protein